MRGEFIDFRFSCYILNRMIDLVIARHSEDINWLYDLEFKIIVEYSYTIKEATSMGHQCITTKL